MNVRMLWLDDDKRRTLEQKVVRAADYYRDKYERNPTLCLVNSAAVATETVFGAIRVKPAVNILPHHFLLGAETGSDTGVPLQQ